MREKIISVLLVVSMVLSMFVGCSTANPAVDPSETSENTIANETEESITEPTEPEATETTPSETTAPVTDPTEPDPTESEPTEMEEDTPETPQRKAVNMLNYITVLTQGIHASNGSRVYLDSVKSSLQNNLSLSAIDSETQKQINNLWKTIDGYSMIDAKRERIEFMYEQNKA